MRVEHHIIIVRVGRNHPVHGPVKLGASAIQVSGGPACCPHRHAHTLGESHRPKPHRGDDPQREGCFTGKQEAGTAADQDRFPRPADGLDQLCQMVKIGFLRSIVLLPQRQQPVLDDAGG